MSPLRILVTGSRYWTDRYTVEVAIRKAYLERGNDCQPHEVTVVHGNASGADECAKVSARVMGFHTEPHPADWEKHGKAAGPIRNAAMTELGADVCLAFPLGESRGTRNCMALAEKAGIRVVVHHDSTEPKDTPAP